MSPIHDSQDTPQTSFRHPTGTNKTPIETSLAPSGGHREKKRMVESHGTY